MQPTSHRSEYTGHDQSGSDGQGADGGCQQKVRQECSRKEGPPPQARPAEGVKIGQKGGQEIALGDSPKKPAGGEQEGEVARVDPHGAGRSFPRNPARGLPTLSSVFGGQEKSPSRASGRTVPWSMVSTARTTRSTEREDMQTFSPPQGGRWTW